MAYVNILADVLSSVAGSVIPPGAEPSRNALMTGITFFGALPIAILVHSPQVTLAAHGNRPSPQSNEHSLIFSTCLPTMMTGHLKGSYVQHHFMRCILFLIPLIEFPAVPPSVIHQWLPHC